MGNATTPNIKEESVTSPIFVCVVCVKQCVCVCVFLFLFLKKKKLEIMCLKKINLKKLCIKQRILVQQIE